MIHINNIDGINRRQSILKFVMEKSPAASKDGVTRHMELSKQGLLPVDPQNKQKANKRGIALDEEKRVDHSRFDIDHDEKKEVQLEVHDDSEEKDAVDDVFKELLTLEEKQQANMLIDSITLPKRTEDIKTQNDVEMDRERESILKP